MKNVEDAALFCHTLGGTLASIHSAEENKFIRGVATRSITALKHKPNSTHDYIMLINLRRVEGTRNFKYMDGSEYNYSHWRKGEPSFKDHDGTIENCVGVYRPLHNYIFQWNDVSCSLGFTSQICQKPANRNHSGMLETSMIPRTATENGFSIVNIAISIFVLVAFSVTVMIIMKRIRKKKERQTFIEMSSRLPTVEMDQMHLYENRRHTTAMFYAENNSYVPDTA